MPAFLFMELVDVVDQFHAETYSIGPVFTIEKIVLHPALKRFDYGFMPLRLQLGRLLVLVTGQV
jgi:hypothetical protein